MIYRTQERPSFLAFITLARETMLAVHEEYPELAKLSFRELEVFTQLLTDKTQEQIARELYVSISSIHFHCKNIYKKLDVSGRRQILVRYRDL